MYIYILTNITKLSFFVKKELHKMYIKNLYNIYIIFTEMWKICERKMHATKVNEPLSSKFSVIIYYNIKIYK